MSGGRAGRRWSAAVPSWRWRPCWRWRAAAVPPGPRPLPPGTRRRPLRPGTRRRPLRPGARRWLLRPGTQRRPTQCLPLPPGSRGQPSPPRWRPRGAKRSPAGTWPSRRPPTTAWTTRSMASPITSAAISPRPRQTCARRQLPSAGSTGSWPRSRSRPGSPSWPARLILANQSRAALADREARSASLARLHSYAARHRAADASVEFGVRLVRKALSLPPPSDS